MLLLLLLYINNIYKLCMDEFILKFKPMYVSDIKGFDFSIILK